MMDGDLLKYLAVLLLVVFAFTPVTLNALKRRRENPPPMAANDRKLYRLWKSDPAAYERQYGQMDKEYLAAQAGRNKRDERGNTDKPSSPDQ